MRPAALSKFAWPTLLGIESNQCIWVIEKVGCQRGAVMEIAEKDAVPIPRLIVGAICPLCIRVVQGLVGALKAGEANNATCSRAAWKSYNILGDRPIHAGEVEVLREISS